MDQTRRNFLKGTAAAVTLSTVPVAAIAAIELKTKPVPVAYCQYCMDVPLRDRGCERASLGEIDLNNPLEGIAKLIAGKKYYGPGTDQTIKIKPGATNVFTLITPEDPNDIDPDYGLGNGSMVEVTIKCEFNPPWGSPKAITAFVPWGDAYFLFTFTPEHRDIIMKKLGLAK